jgi:hypothetical protein
MNDTFFPILILWLLGCDRGRLGFDSFAGREGCDDCRCGGGNNSDILPLLALLCLLRPGCGCNGR